MAGPTRIQFLDLVERFVRTRFPLVNLQRNEAEFLVGINGHWTSLENLYRIALQEPDGFERNTERWVVELLRASEGMPDHSGTFEQLKDHILPVVLPAHHPDSTVRTMITQLLLDELRVGYALDSQRSMAYIPRKLFHEWGISIDQLHEIALANLVARSQVLQAQAAQDEGGGVNLVLIQTMDGYDASRILLPGLHEHLKEFLGSQFVAAIPNRDILICFRNREQTVATMQRQVEDDFRTMPHQITPRFFLITADGIAPWSA